MKVGLMWFIQAPEADGREASYGQAVVKSQRNSVQLGVMAKASKERAGTSPQKANLALTW